MNSKVTDEDMNANLDAKTAKRTATTGCGQGTVFGDRLPNRSRKKLFKEAAELVHEGRFGRMAALHGDRIVDVSLADATAELKTVPPERYAEAEVFFG